MRHAVLRRVGYLLIGVLFCTAIMTGQRRDDLALYAKAYKIPYSQQSREEIERLADTTDLEEQMRMFGIWDQWKWGEARTHRVIALALHEGSGCEPSGPFALYRANGRDAAFCRGSAG